MGDTNLFQASAQWAVRPDDERFGSVPELLTATRGYHQATRQKLLPWSEVTVSATEPDAGNPHGEIVLSGAQGIPARMTHFAFGQLCNRAQVKKYDALSGETVSQSSPASYLRMLPAPLAVDCLKYGLDSRAGDAFLQFHQNGGLVCKSLTTEKYSPFWNYQIAERLSALSENGWKVPPARPARAGQKGTRIATEADVIASDAWALSVSVGDTIAPAGLYASDHDLFVFMINPEREIGRGLFRGFFCWNSEVGAKSFGLTTFLFNHVCGNHIVWSADEIKTLRVRHVGDVQERAAEMIGIVHEYADASADKDRERVEQTRTYRLGTDRETVLDTIFKMRIAGLSKKRADESYSTALEYADAENYDPNTAWGFAQGVTRLSQSIPYADQRTDLDTAAGKVLEAAF